MTSLTEAVRVDALIDVMAAARPRHPALIYGERRWTYAQLRAEMDRRAARMVEVGLAPGDGVLAAAPLTDDLTIAFLACARADIAFLHFSSKATGAELGPSVARARVRFALTPDGASHPALPALPALPFGIVGSPNGSTIAALAGKMRPADGDAVVFIQPTSGTTGGNTKLVPITHRTLTWMRMTPPWWQTADGVYYKPRPDFLPIRTLIEVLSVGGTLVFSPVTRPEQIEAEMAARRVTALWTTPSILQPVTDLRGDPPDLALRVIRSGAAPLTADLARAIHERYGVPIIQEYGSTEGGAMLCTPACGAPEGSVGVPYPGVSVRLVDSAGLEVPVGTVGNVTVRSPGTMTGYLEDTEGTAAVLRDGWLWTGDLARRDAQGYYYLAGRSLLRINVNGLKVAPEEVEAVLQQHPAVREAVVLGAVDSLHGEVVRAVIVPRDQAPSVRDLRRYCRERLSPHKVPRRWEFREELPRSPLGKVLRSAL